MTRTLRLALALAAALTLALALTAGTAAAQKPDFWLTVLHNNDGESKLLGLEIENEEGEIERYGGVARSRPSSTDSSARRRGRARRAARSAPS